MSLLDISQVTRALITLLENHVQASPIWPNGQALSVVPDPPDRLAGPNSLGVYLYHMQEDPHNKNRLPIGNSQPPIRFTPMPVLLYYQVSAHSDLASPTGSFREQLMLGAAIKALHDFPVINDDTQVAGSDVFPALLKDGDNRFEIELRPVGPDEAVNFWTAGSSPLRLAAYYCVSVAMLEPEEIESSAGPVFDYNVYALPNSRAFITSSSNTVRFTAPGETTQREFELRPAQVAVGDTFHLHGVNFVSDDTTLVLGFADWPEEQLINAADWGLQVSPEKISAIVQESAQAQTVVPGVYTVGVKTVQEAHNSEGGVYRSESTSSRTSISIIPRLDSVSSPDATGEFQVDGYLFEHALIAADGLRVFVAEQRLSAGTAGSLAPGEFAVTSSTSVSIRLPQDVTRPAPLRISINGAESVTQWVT
ncbi:MAG: DUF4255 domain-containing protein [Pseudomonadota bacterium]